MVGKTVDCPERRATKKESPTRKRGAGVEARGLQQKE
nr:MAG TPA: hypothetical protein [Caudoviricetes sp.]